MRKKKVKFFIEFSKTDNVYFNYQKVVAYYESRFGLAYPLHLSKCGYLQLMLLMP